MRPKWNQQFEFWHSSDTAMWRQRCRPRLATAFSRIQGVLQRWQGHSFARGPSSSAESGFRRAGDVLRLQHPDLLVSKRRLRQTETIQVVRERRESETQNLGVSSRPFVLCGLPVKRPSPGCLLHERRNGQFVLQVTGHPSYGLPWGQDRLIPIFLATLAIRQQRSRITFDSAAEMLDTFGMQQGGSQYRRLIEAFQRVFGATIFFGTDTQLKARSSTRCASTS